MKNKKIVFLDVDGTLCLDDQSVPASAAKSIKKARENGHLMYLCTGRSKPEIYDNILEIGFDGIIGAGGGFCESNGEVVFHKQVTPGQVRHAVDYFNENNIDFYIESNGGLYASKNCVSKMVELVIASGMVDAKEAEKFPFIQALTQGEDLYRDDINKICFLDNETVPFAEIKKEFDGEYEVMHATVPAFGKNSGELAVVGVHKANAIEELLAYLHLDREDTIGIGDGMNDLEMLEYCNIGIAVANGHEDLKKMADYVTDANTEDGIEKAFRKYLLI